MCDRKTEMERKKAKLNELREEQKRRRLLRESQDASAFPFRRVGNGGARGQTSVSNESLDNLLSSFGLTPIDQEPGDHQNNEPIEVTSQVVGHLRDKSSQTVASKQSRIASLCKDIRAVVNIPPKEIITYAKHTQTDATSPESKEPEVLNSLKRSAGGGDMPTSISDEVVQTVTQTEDTAIQELESRPMSDTEKQMILMSDDFLVFFGRTSRYVERALAEETDIFKDYTKDSATTVEPTDPKPLLSLRRHFAQDTPHCGFVTSLDWSTHHPELILAGYHVDRQSIKVEDGLCVVWNMAYNTKTPEYVFRCGSRVMSGKFTGFHPNLVVGATYSGQIVLWDTRYHKKTPVSQSPLKMGSHVHPVCSLNMVGTLSAHNLVSTSADGLVCTWSLEMLSKPQEALEVKTREGRSVYPMCVDFPYNDGDNFLIGSGFGLIHHTCRLGIQPGVADSMFGHHGPVTQISAPAVPGCDRFSHLYLTSSFDRSVKLWSRQSSVPAHSFECFQEDVLDVQWSPAHPAAFAAVDGEGRLQIWNLSALNADRYEVPAVETWVPDSPALNRVAWARSGKQIAVGDDRGGVWVYDVGDRLAKPTERDWAAMTAAFGLDRHERDKPREDCNESKDNREL